MKNRVKLSVSGLALLVVLGVTSSASAQSSNTGFAVNRFEPSERGSEWFALESLDFRGSGRVSAGLVGDYQFRPLAIYGADGAVKTSVVKHVATAHLGASIVVSERLRIGASIPVVAFQNGEAGTLAGTPYAAPSSAQAVGDARIGLDVRLLGTYGGAFSLAAGAQGWIPTGSRSAYTSDGKIRIAPRLLVAGTAGSFEYAGRLSYIYRGRDDNYAGGALGSEFGYAASAGIRVADGKLVVGPELFGTTVVSSSTSADVFAKRSSPLEGILGAHYTAGDLRFGVGAGAGLTRGFGSPLARGLVSVEYVPAIVPVIAPVDQDGDGINDDHDACVGVAGVAQADPTKNGCPLADGDNDGIVDADDKCPAGAGPKATGGCPDKDGDLIADTVDACIDTAGVSSADASKNGCPADGDGDGIPDAVDACVGKAGPKTNDPKTSGCPDPDRDHDGIANDSDACPDEAGKADKDPKRNGCPRAFVSDGQIRILDQVKFKTGSAVIEKGDMGEGVVLAVLDVLKKNSDIKKLRVEGHTDARGNAASNKKLSQARAEAVVEYLVKNGMPKAMFTAVGFGQEKPIADNGTDAGRQANRRVEFHIGDK